MTRQGVKMQWMTCLGCAFLAAFFIAGTSFDAAAEEAPPKLESVDSTVVRSSDRLSLADPALPIRSQQWNLLCSGSTAAAWKLPALPLIKRLEAGATYTAFQVVDLPDAPLGRAFRLSAHLLDTDAKSKHRCEISHTAGRDGRTPLPTGQVFWHALSFRTWQWPRYDDEQIVAQWLPLTGTPQNPMMALKLVRGRIELQVRTNSTPGAPKDKNEARTVWRQHDFDANQWHDFVFQARISPDAAKMPFLQLWVDGAKVVEHRAPIGYVGNARVVAKFGIYRYVQTRQGGAWPAGMDVRQMDFGRSVVVADTEGRYGVDDLRREIGR